MLQIRQVNNFRRDKNFQLFLQQLQLEQNSLCQAYIARNQNFQRENMYQLDRQSHCSSSLQSREDIVCLPCTLCKHLFHLHNNRVRRSRSFCLNYPCIGGLAGTGCSKSCQCQQSSNKASCKMNNLVEQAASLGRIIQEERPSSASYRELSNNQVCMVLAFSNPLQGKLLQLGITIRKREVLVR